MLERSFIWVSKEIRICFGILSVLYIFSIATKTKDLDVLTRPTGSSKYGTTRKNIQRYYTPKHLIRYIYSILTRVLYYPVFVDIQMTRSPAFKRPRFRLQLRPEPSA